MFKLFLALFVSLCSVTQADELQLLVRAGEDNYSLPYMSSLSNTNPSLNDASQTLFRYWGYNDQTTQTEQRLWLSQLNQGQTIYTAPDEWLITDPKFYGNHTVIFTLSDYRVTGGLWQIDLSNQTQPNVRLVIDPKKYSRFEAMSSAARLSDQSYLFRGMDRQGRRHLVNFTTNQQMIDLISEGEVFQDQTVTYVFSPFTTGNAVALKVSFEQNDQMLVRVNHEWKSIATTGKEIQSMQNNGSVNSRGDVAFIGVDLKGVQQIYLFQNAQLKSSAHIKGRELISRFETFAPSLNDQGQIAFRALDERGYRSLFLWNNEGLKKIVSEGDQVPLENNGTGRIFLGAWGPGFAGAPSLNNQGEISFAVTLMEKHQDQRLGSALYLYRP